MSVESVEARCIGRATTYVDDVQSLAASGVEDGWRFVKTTTDTVTEVDIFQRTVDGSSIDAIKGVGIIPYPPRLVWSFVADIRTMPECDKMCLEANLIKRIDARHAFMHAGYDSGVAIVKNRDFVIFCCDYELPHGCYTSTAVSVDHPDRPPTKAYVRGEVLSSGYYFEPIAALGGSETHTRVTYVVQLDPKGWVPAWLQNMLANEQALVVNQVREALDRRAAAGTLRDIALLGTGQYEDRDGDSVGGSDEAGGSGSRWIPAGFGGGGGGFGDDEDDDDDDASLCSALEYQPRVGSTGDATVVNVNDGGLPVAAAVVRRYPCLPVFPDYWTPYWIAKYLIYGWTVLLSGLILMLATRSGPPVSTTSEFGRESFWDGCLLGGALIVAWVWMLLSDSGLIFVIRQGVVDRLGLNGDEQILNFPTWKGTWANGFAAEMTSGHVTAAMVGDHGRRHAAVVAANVRLEGNAHYVTIDQVDSLYRTPYDDDAFDIVCVELRLAQVEMWPAKKQHLAFLAEVRRVLRPGGRLVMVNAGVGSVIWLHRLRQAGFFVEKTKIHWGVLPLVRTTFAKLPVPGRPPFVAPTAAALAAGDDNERTALLGSSRQPTDHYRPGRKAFVWFWVVAVAASLSYAVYAVFHNWTVLMVPDNVPFGLQLGNQCVWNCLFVPVCALEFHDEMAAKLRQPIGWCRIIGHLLLCLFSIFVGIVVFTGFFWGPAVGIVIWSEAGNGEDWSNGEANTLQIGMFIGAILVGIAAYSTVSRCKKPPTD